MSITRITAIAILVLITFTANIQAQTPTVSSVTGTITSEGTVRMIAHGEALQIRMEIYSPSGELVSDSSLRRKYLDRLQDLTGVSLAAIKELHQRTDQLQQKTAEVEQLRAQVNQLQLANSELEKRLATLEQLMLGQVQQQQTPKLH